MNSSNRVDEYRELTRLKQKHTDLINDLLNLIVNASDGIIPVYKLKDTLRNYADELHEDC